MYPVVPYSTQSAGTYSLRTQYSIGYTPSNNQRGAWVCVNGVQCI